MKELYFTQKDLDIRWQEASKFFKEDLEEELYLKQSELIKRIDLIENSFLVKLLSVRRKGKWI